MIDETRQAEELMQVLRQLRRLSSQRDRLPFDSIERVPLDEEIDETQRHAWQIAAAWGPGRETRQPPDEGAAD